MNQVERQMPEESPIRRMQEIQERLRRLERRDWWLWWAAVVVMLLLTVGVVSLSFPTLMQTDAFYKLQLSLAVRGLVGLVLLFNTYTIYQQVVIKRLRRQLAEQIEVMVRLEMRAQEFRRLAMHDPLTGLFNRRFAEDRLRAEMDRSRRYGHPLSVLLIDLNDFKQINDQLGHAAGDQVLKHFAEQLDRVTRVSDFAARLGGDEFMVVLPECPPEHCQQLLERLGTPETAYNGSPIVIRFAAGWSGFQPDDTLEHMLDRADQALYTNKRATKALPVPAAS